MCLQIICLVQAMYLTIPWRWQQVSVIVPPYSFESARATSDTLGLGSLTHLIKISMIALIAKTVDGRFNCLHPNFNFSSIHSLLRLL